MATISRKLERSQRGGPRTPPAECGTRTSSLQKQAATRSRGRDATQRTQTLAKTAAQSKSANSSVILPESEWQRITGTIAPSTATASFAETKRRDREALHSQSNAMVRTWDNTLEGQRLKRLERLKVKAQAEEEEHKRLDLEEAQYQAERRKEAIAQAREGLLRRTDRVKKFDEALVLSEVLREREAQVEFKRRKEVRKLGMDADFVQRLEADRVQALRDEAAKRQKKMAASRETTVLQLRQVQDKAENKCDERRQMLREQLESDRLAEQYFEEQRELERKLADDKVKIKEIYDRTLQDKKAAVQQKTLEDDLESEEVRLFAVAKQRMTQLRRRKEKEILGKVRERQDAMCSKLHGVALKELDDEDREIAEALAQTNAKRDREAKDKQDMYAQRQRDITEHRDRVMEAHGQLKKEEARRQVELMKQERELDRQFHLERFEEDAQRRQRNEVTQQELVKQAHTRLEKEQAEIAEQIRHDEHALEKQMEGERDFKEYAKRTIAEAKQRQAPTHVLQRALEVAPCGGHGPALVERGGIKPSFMAMDSFGTELKGFAAPRGLPCVEDGGVKGKTAPAARKFPGNTKKRTGFVW